jgi:hypothetical protein
LRLNYLRGAYVAEGQRLQRCGSSYPQCHLGFRVSYAMASLHIYARPFALRLSYAALSRITLAGKRGGRPPHFNVRKPRRQPLIPTGSDRDEVRLRGEDAMRGEQSSTGPTSPSRMRSGGPTVILVARHPVAGGKLRASIRAPSARRQSPLLVDGGIARSSSRNGKQRQAW